MAKTGLIVVLIVLGIVLIAGIAVVLIVKPFEPEPYQYNLTASDEKLVFSQNSFGFEVMSKGLIINLKERSALLLTFSKNELGQC